MDGIGPIDPWLARDLARAAARNPKTTWCVTVTDQQGHAIGHGCARPEPKSHRRERAERRKPGPPDGRDPPRGTSGTPHRGSPSRPPARTARRADTAPGGCAPGPAETRICSSPSTRLPPATATTATRPRVTTPASSSAISLRSGTPPAPGWPAGDPPPNPISSTTSRTRPVAERVCVMAVRSAGSATASSRIPGGTSISFPTVPSDGRPRPDASTRPSPRATRFDPAPATSEQTPIKHGAGLAVRRIAAGGLPGSYANRCRTCHVCVTWMLPSQGKLTAGQPPHLPRVFDLR